MLNIWKNSAAIQIFRRHTMLWLVLMTSCLVALTLRPDDDLASQKISIKSLGDRYELMVPVSRLIMTIPKSGLTLENQAIGGATDSPRYFKFEDRARAIIISGWFESADQYKGFKKYWKGEMRGWEKKGLPAPQSVVIEKQGNWEIVTYDSPVPTKKEFAHVSNVHLKAEWTQEGTWIDLHLSITSEHSSEESRKILRALLQSIQMRAKE